MQNKNITTPVSKAVIARLPRYYRYLRELLSQDILRISSGELARLMNVTASQIRQDLNCFGGFGQQGYGYNVKNLYKAIGDILGVDESYTAVIVGAGDMGKALATGTTFVGRGVHLKGIFDSDPDRIGKEVGEYTVLPMERLADYCHEWKPTIAALAVPRLSARKTAEQLSLLGVKGIWNFTGEELIVPETVSVENVHLGDLLMTLCYEIHAKEQPDEETEN
ncbi:MAG: redox-sensing transcriptional repressor Rex [Clostridia bacterium]|nr:redox-sensing transcriptional repressor Rex [Clostridia bacterium]